MDIHVLIYGYMDIWIDVGIWRDRWMDGWMYLRGHKDGVLLGPNLCADTQRLAVETSLARCLCIQFLMYGVV